jgi:5-formyltetrahydrofolate cyclo-ligase
MTDDNGAAKRDMRKTLISKRMELGNREISLKSTKIADNLYASGLLDRKRAVLVYNSIKNEVDTCEIVKYLKSRDIGTVFPRIERDASGQKIMELYESGCDTCFVQGLFGILEPDPVSCLPAEVTDIDLALVPGVAFDLGFQRLGYGGGFYDSFIALSKKSCFKAALAFEMQIVDRVPANEYDYAVDCIITEEKVYYYG